MTDVNRAEAQAELRQVIADAFAAKTLWTTDWPAVQLTRFCLLNSVVAFSLISAFLSLHSQSGAETHTKLRQPEEKNVSFGHIVRFLQNPDKTPISDKTALLQTKK
jgi:hypothetical protein